MTKAVYRFHLDCGRQGDLQGVFVDTKERVEKLISSGITVYFGEVLGKHSEVYSSISKGDIKLISDSPEVVKVVEENDLENGFNPFIYPSIRFEIEGEDIDDLEVGDIIDKLLK